MKYLLVLYCIVVGQLAFGQEPATAEKGITYGAGSTSEGAIHVNDVEKHIKNNKFEGKIMGKGGRGLPGKRMLDEN
jgi:hypothetical protein